MISVLHIATNILESIGAIIIIGAAAAAVVNLARSLYRRQLREIIERARLQFAQHLVLALEFLIAADILASIHIPTRDGLFLLGAIIAMRTVLSLSIAYELRHANSALMSVGYNLSAEEKRDGGAP